MYHSRVMTDAWMAQAVCFALHAPDDPAVGRAERRVRAHLARPPRRHSGYVRIKVRGLTCAFMLREYASPNMSLRARISVAVQGWANAADMRRRRHRTCVPVLGGIKFKVYIINSQSVQPYHTTTHNAPQARDRPPGPPPQRRTHAPCPCQWARCWTRECLPRAPLNEGQIRLKVRSAYARISVHAQPRAYRW